MGFRLARGPPFGNSRRPASRHQLRLRPAGGVGAAVDPAAPGAPLPHAGAELFAQGHAGQPLRQLAAGPARQLAGALRFSRAGRAVQDRSRSDRRAGGGQSIRLLRRALRRGFSLRLCGGAGDRACRLSHARARRAVAEGICRRNRRTARPDDPVPRCAQRRTAADDPLRHPLGGRRPGARRYARFAFRLLPRFGLAAWCRSCAGSVSRRASSPAISSSSGPTSIRSKGRAARTRISPICTPGRRSISPAPAGSAWTPPPACSAAKAISPSARRRISARRRRSPVWSDRRM